MSMKTVIQNFAKDLKKTMHTTESLFDLITAYLPKFEDNASGFLDTSNVVYQGFTYDGEYRTWTATENCILAGTIYDAGSGKIYNIQLNDVGVLAGTSVGCVYIPVSVGDVVKYRAGSSSNFKAYAIK